MIGARPPPRPRRRPGHIVGTGLGRRPPGLGLRLEVNVGPAGPKHEGVPYASIPTVG
jgi:hypothetical protein